MTEINDSQQLFADNEFANGSFEVNDAANGVFLTVHPPEGLGEPVAQKDVWGQLSLVAHESLYDKELVMHVIQEAKGIPTLLFEKTKAKIEIAFSRTRMEATIKVNMKKGNLPVTLADMTAQIAQDGVNYGISNSAVEAALATPNQAFIFANGLPSIDGENAYIKYYVDFAAKGKPVELENGRVDFKNLNNYVIVEKNKMIAQKFPPTPGTPGVNVLGETLLPKPGKDVLLPLGKNVVTDDGLIIKADRAGHVLIINGKVNVSDKIEIKEDIDLTTGNIDFIGSVLVRGSVQNGFSVKAGADVEIHGLVSGGVVEGNNIIVRTGIQGGEHGYVVARESIITKFMENATAYANSNITVSDVILNSKVSAGKHLIVNGKIIGGIVSAGEKIRTGTVGTRNHVNTTLQVGVNPRLREEYQKLIKEVFNVEENLAKMKVTLDVLRSMDRASLSPQQQNLFLRLTKSQFQLVGQETTMKKRIKEIEGIFAEMRLGKIEVTEIIYPGSKVIVGNLAKIIMEPIKFSSFYAESGDVKLGVI